MQIPLILGMGPSSVSRNTDWDQKAKSTKLLSMLMFGELDHARLRRTIQLNNLGDEYYPVQNKNKHYEDGLDQASAKVRFRRLVSNGALSNGRDVLLFGSKVIKSVSNITNNLSLLSSNAGGKARFYTHAALKGNLENLGQLNCQYDFVGYAVNHPSYFLRQDPSSTLEIKLIKFCKILRKVTGLFDAEPSKQMLLEYLDIIRFSPKEIGSNQVRGGKFGIADYDEVEEDYDEVEEVDEEESEILAEIDSIQEERERSNDDGWPFADSNEEN